LKKNVLDLWRHKGGKVSGREILFNNGAQSKGENAAKGKVRTTVANLSKNAAQRKKREEAIVGYILN